MSRFYRHLAEAGITLGIDQQGGDVRVALTACNIDDRFDQRTGRDIIDVLFDKGSNTIRAFGLKKRVIVFPYAGKKPKLEIFGALIDQLADALGERSFYRKLYQLFMDGVVSREIAETLGSESLQKWNDISAVIDTQSKELLKDLLTEEDLHKAFFDYRGSVKTIETELKRFASRAIQQKIDFDRNKASDRKAPRRSGEDVELVKTMEAPEPQGVLAPQKKIAAKSIKVTVK